MLLCLGSGFSLLPAAGIALGENLVGHCGTLARSTVRHSRGFELLRRAIAPFDLEIAPLALAASALVLRVAVSGDVPVSELRTYCLIVGIAAAAATVFTVFTGRHFSAR